MDWITSKIKWIMLVSGALTFTMIYAAIAPDAALRSSFGDTLHGPVAGVVVRNWGVLIALVGVMLMYAAFHPPLQRFTVCIAGISKLAFIALVLSKGTLFLAHQAGIAVVFDSLMVLLYAWFLMATRSSKASAARA
jgi:hypothetical protein